MRYLLAAALLVTGLTFNDAAWAATEKTMGLEATISMEQALRTAIASVPDSKPYEVEMEKEDGRISYKIALVDPAKKTYKVLIDAQNGQLLKKK